MSQVRKALARMREGSNNVALADLKLVLRAFGFELARTKGSHEIWKHGSGIAMNIQTNGGGKAKPYQVTQVLNAVAGLSDEITKGELGDSPDERE